MDGHLSTQCVSCAALKEFPKCLIKINSGNAESEV